MKNFFSIFTLVTLIVACQHTNNNSKKAQSDNADQSNTNNDAAAKRSAGDVPPGSLSWSDSLLKMYMTFADNKSIKQARNANYYEDWIYDNTLNTDSAVYDVYRIGHDVPKQDYSDTQFVVDQWVYIDTKRKQLFEYDVTGKKLTRWWTSEDMKLFFYPVYELSPKTTAMVVSFSDYGDPEGKLDSLFDQVAQTDSLHLLEGVPKTCTMYDSSGTYRLLKSNKLEKKIRKYFNKEFYVYGTKGFVKTGIKDIVYGLDECRTSIFAFCLDKSTVKSIGHPVFCSNILIDLTYSGDYSNIEKKLEHYHSQLPADYRDSIKTMVAGNIGDFYFTYDDDYLWGQKQASSKCDFPARCIYYVSKKEAVVNFGMHWLDLFGIACD